MNWDEVRASRVARSHLGVRAPAAKLVEVVRDVCGIHAQVMGSAELQLAARVEGITQADVREALWERRTLAKTWTTRGTLHIHPADELSLWTSALRAVEDEEDAAVTAAIGEALRGRRLTREELADAVVERVGPEPRERLASGWGWFLGDAAAAGLLCFGPPEGAKVTFVHVGGLARPAARRGSRRKRCARSRAATRTPTRRPGSRQLREWLAAKVDVDVPDVALEPAAVSSVRLLPEYDPYVMGFREREHLVPPAVREQVKAHGKGRYEGPAGTPFLVSTGSRPGSGAAEDGEADRADGDARTQASPHERAGVEDEAERIGAFLALEPSLSIL